jgi:hypothetical protein
MQKSSQRLLLNAEPFGFGPAAAIAGFLPHLRPHFNTIGYIGKKHTLDLQRGLPYDAVHDVTGTARDEREETYAPVFAQYDIFLTAMDHKMAEAAQKAGLKVIYYDALAWYWPEIPDSMRKTDLYIAQDFFGVRERLSAVFNDSARAQIVPPIAPAGKSAQAKDHVLINLGGLQNPFWPVEDVVDYARAVVAALRRALPDEKIVIAGSQAVADKMAAEGVRTIPRVEMEDILARSKMAFMTPGLGNIYDAAAFDLPTIWLPPANDSQGQQMRLIEEKGLSDGAMDWHDILRSDAIDYRADQPAVLAQIAAAAKILSADSAAQNRLAAAAVKLRGETGAGGSRTVGLLEKFGTGGEEQVAKLVIAKARELDLG